MADVFLSYARQSLDQAMGAAHCLRAAGYSVWFDQSLPAHRAYSDVIAEELDAASAVLVLWSAHAAASQWVRSEANRARETDRLVQLRLDGARLPMPFDQVQCVDLAGWSGECDAAGWRMVIDSIAALTGNTKHVPAPVAVRQPTVGNRRQWLLAGGATAVLVAASGVLKDRREEQLSPEAALLLQKGLDALQANDALDPEDEGSTGQAVALLTQATGAAPNSATAWGGLALAYAVRRRASPEADRPGLESRGLAAADAALRLDRKEPRALAAQRIVAPVYRNWMAAEEADRHALQKNPRYPILLFILSDVLGSVGRWRDATKLSNRLDRTKFLLPGAERKAILNLWAAGDLRSADEAIKAAVERWPDQRQVWRTRIAYLLYSGKPSEALAILTDRSNRPLDVLPATIEAVSATARALTGQMAASEAVRINLAYLDGNTSAALPVAHATVALGDSATAFQLLDGYYFGEGDWAKLAPRGGDQDRQTSPLFQPPMQPVWRTTEFNRLIERIGLNDYWRKSRTTPDFRLGS